MPRIIFKNVDNLFFTFTAPPPDFGALAEFLSDVFGDTDFTYTLLFIHDPGIAGRGFNMSTLSKEKNMIVISSLYAGEPDIKIPKNKFIQLLDTLKSHAHLIAQKDKIKRIIFDFDDDWNCTITAQDEE